MMKPTTRKGPRWIWRDLFFPMIGSMIIQAVRLAIKRVLMASQGCERTRAIATARGQSPSPTHLPLETR